MTRPEANPELNNPFVRSIENQDPPDNTSLLNPSGVCHGPNQSVLPLVDGDPIEVPVVSDTCFNYITSLLSEEDSDDRPNATLQDYMAFQVMYQSSDTALLGETCSSLTNRCPPPVCQNSPFSCSDDHLNMFSFVSDTGFTYPSVANYETSSVSNSLLESQMPSLALGWDRNLYPSIQIEPAFGQSPVAPMGNVTSSCPHSFGENVNKIVNFQEPINRNVEIALGAAECCDSTGKPKGRKYGEGGDRENKVGIERRAKQSAPSNEVFELIERYGDGLFCPEGFCNTINKTNNDPQNDDDQKLQKKEMTSSKGSKKKHGNKSEMVDFQSLLSRCAQCVASVNLTGAYELLKQIRQHSSPHGDYLQRVAHYLANGLEARLKGNGLEINSANEQITPCEMLKANRIYVASVPFKIMSYYTTNKTIGRLVDEGAPSIHIIDFGIFYGLQWPCIIRNFSKRPNGPPKIRITGIDFPQCGFRPAERVEEAGRCLAKYCERHNVPFEYHAMAKKWEDIQLEDLKIERNELLVVNCLYRSHNLFDESVEEDSPRDAFLSLVKMIKPNIFIHGIVNTTLTVPFFLNRFKEAMYHYTALFDLFEATMMREDNERMLLESKLYGNQALNVIACEGMERIERPETYKQWQVRTQRAGFVQVPFDRDISRMARAIVRKNFRDEFIYDEDDYWVIQGWKGRILYAISCWKIQEV